jgi:excisionase family DNA binding protein
MNIIEEKNKKINDPVLFKKAELMYERLKKYPAMLTTKEVAEICQVKDNTVRIWVMRNQIPHTKCGGATRFALADIIFWLLEKKKNSQKQKCL